MVGSPYQTSENLLADLRFLQTLMPDMIGIGPYITHHETPFFDKPSGDFKLTLRMVAILRLMFLPILTLLITPVSIYYRIFLWMKAVTL